jgi:hypothetical protein
MLLQELIMPADTAITVSTKEKRKSSEELIRPEDKRPCTGYARANSNISWPDVNGVDLAPFLQQLYPVLRYICSVPVDRRQLAQMAFQYEPINSLVRVLGTGSGYMISTGIFLVPVAVRTYGIRLQLLADTLRSTGAPNEEDIAKHLNRDPRLRTHSSRVHIITSLFSGLFASILTVQVSSEFPKTIEIVPIMDNIEYGCASSSYIVFERLFYKVQVFRLLKDWIRGLELVSSYILRPGKVFDASSAVNETDKTYFPIQKSCSTDMEMFKNQRLWSKRAFSILCHLKRNEALQTEE